ncbi:unnamed protein product [Triticum turgidum subsp. durum]|uniref:NPH3 domain-containing protein n=1 Tax=Triticum turgidum subsp. durum TaxID=4567 RepID=A0A9R1P7F9_TRITD|nr:unnamed protein product [Triticum turgidum subsp. durum]
MLRTATVLHASAACRDALERRAGEQVEKAALEDLLIPNTSYSTDTLYDVDCMQRMLEQFLLSNTTAYADPLPEITADEAPPGELMPASTVAKLVDGYLAEVGTDANLKCSQFQQIVALVPDYARSLDDGLYRAIDIFIKVGIDLGESRYTSFPSIILARNRYSLEERIGAASFDNSPRDRTFNTYTFYEQ